MLNDLNFCFHRKEGWLISSSELKVVEITEKEKTKRKKLEIEKIVADRDKWSKIALIVGSGVVATAIAIGIFWFGRF